MSTSVETQFVQHFFQISFFVCEAKKPQFFSAQVEDLSKKQLP